jgi:Peptidase inhibitor family I36
MTRASRAKRLDDERNSKSSMKDQKHESRARLVPNTRDRQVSQRFIPLPSCPRGIYLPKPELEDAMQRFIKGCVLGVTVSSLLMGCGGGTDSAAPPATPAVPPAASSAAAPTVCATFYADAHLKGATIVSNGPTDNSATIPATFNDAMSSVAVTAGCTVMVYPDGNFGGQAATFTQTTEVVPANINDQMSSYKCTCGGGT